MRHGWKLLRRSGALFTVTATVTGGLTAASPPVVAAPVKAPTVQRERMLPNRRVDSTPVSTSVSSSAVSAPPRSGMAFPATAHGTVLVPAHGSATAVGVPLTLASAGGSRSAHSMNVSVLGHADSARAGVRGVLFAVTPGAASRSTANDGTPLTATIDYSGFANAVGANFGNRLRLVQLPACALTTPDVASCRTQKPVSYRNDPSSQTLTTNAVATSGTTMLAATAGASGSEGTFEASSLAPSGSWSVSGASGSFTWSYPVTLPPSATGDAVAPNVALSYNSGAVDGRISSTNNQSSEFGEGWNWTAGYIERTYRSCSEDKTLPTSSQTGDQCWAGQLLTMNLGGKTSAIVHDDTTGEWHPEADDGERIERLTGASNGANGGEYWRITNTDGVQYYFGLNVLPGGTSADATNSVWTVPVYGAHSGDPCYDSSGFGKSSCPQAWRWNLDYVEDPHHNATAYTYKAETNYYGANNNTTPVAYTRGGYPVRIDYGLRKLGGTIYNSTAWPSPQRVTFGVDERCTVTSSFDCDPSKFNSTNATNWPDTPQDQDCGSSGTCDNHSPTFWSRKRVDAIDTSYYSGSAYKTVDHYALGQSFPQLGDPELELDSITRTGYASDGSSITLPSVNLAYQQRANRVDNYLNMPSMLHERLTSIRNETGEVISVHYSGDDGQAGRAQPLCTASTIPSTPSQDGAECFQVYWTPPYQSDPVQDWFHKYVVTEVDVQDANGTAPTRQTTYTYVGQPAWHYDDNEIVKPKHRTYGQFRGYGTVQTRTGNPNNVSNGTSDAWTLSTATYFRGMDGDTLPNGATRSASVSDSLGESFTDVDQIADTPLEVRSFNGDTSTQLTSHVTNSSVIATTASHARSGLPDLKATVVRNTKDRAYTNLAAGGTMNTTTASSYDNLGRTTQVSETATGAAARCTTTSYADNTSSWIRSRVSEVIKSAQTCPAPGTAPSPVVSDVRTYFDNSTTLGSVPGAGEVTRTDTATASVGGVLHFAKQTASFDTAGRPRTSTAYTDSADTVGRTTRTDYTPADGGPLTKTVVTNAAGQTTTTVMDAGRGSTTRSVDVAGHATDATYDALGRLTATWKPGQVMGTTPATVTYSYLESPAAPLAVTTKTLVDPGNGATPGYTTSVAIYDAFGGLRQTQNDAVGGGRVVTDTYTDSHGWIIRTNDHWYTSGAPSTGLITTADSGIDDRIVNTYDGSGRKTLSTEYKGTASTWSTKTVYSGDRTTTIPPAGGVETTKVVDARGQTIETDEWTTAPTITGNTLSGGAARKTTYHYDSLGNQDQVTTAAGTTLAATWKTTFDLAGRSVGKTDPDGGSTSTSYNDTGEALSSTDAKPQTLAFTYDSLGRKTGEYAGSTSGTKLADWVWDTKQSGRLTSSTRYLNGKSYTSTAVGYDGAGNALGNTISLSETGFAASYTTNYTWTSTGLESSRTLSASTLPAETITEYYDQFGNPTATTGTSAYVSASSYSPFGEPNQYTLGVNTSTAWLTYTRDAQTRRVSTVNLSAQIPTPQLDNIAYTYDAVGNLTRSIDTQGASGAATDTQCFKYDKLQQLSEAYTSTDSCATDPSVLGNNSKVGGPQQFWFNWTVDAAGNRTKQVQHKVPNSSVTDITTVYALTTTGHPHAVSSATNSGGSTAKSTYGYDANGNMTARTTPSTGAETIAYDLEHRTSAITTSTTSVSYVNDADGNQLLRKDGATTTLYLPGQEISVNGTTTNVTRYYSHNGVVVAERVNRGTPMYLLADPHSSNQVAVTPTTTSTWTVVRRYLDPFGNSLSGGSGTWPDNHAFLDKPRSATTGLTDLGARQYDATIGRFLSVDPMLEVDSPSQLNGYNYGGNNPIAHADPTGKMYPPDMGPYVSHPAPSSSPSPTSSGGGRTPTSTTTSSGGSSTGGGGYSYSPARPKYVIGPAKDYKEYKEYENPFELPCSGFSVSIVSDCASHGLEPFAGLGMISTRASYLMRAGETAAERSSNARIMSMVSRNASLRNAARFGRSDLLEQGSRYLAVVGFVGTMGEDMNDKGYGVVHAATDAGLKTAGGWAGAEIGAVQGAEWGAFAGSFIGPEGTVIGAAVGGIVGGVVGGMAGTAIGGAVSDGLSSVGGAVSSGLSSVGSGLSSAGSAAKSVVGKIGGLFG